MNYYSPPFLIVGSSWSKRVRSRKWCDLSNFHTTNQIWIKKPICKGSKMLRVNFYVYRSKAAFDVMEWTWWVELVKCLSLWFQKSTRISSFYLFSANSICHNGKNVMSWTSEMFTFIASKCKKRQCTRKSFLRISLKLDLP